MERAVLKGAPQGTKRTKVIFLHLLAVRNELISRVLALVAPDSFLGLREMCRRFCVVYYMHKDGSCNVVKLLVKAILKSTGTLISFVAALFLRFYVPGCILFTSVSLTDGVYS